MNRNLMIRSMMLFVSFSILSNASWAAPSMIALVGRVGSTNVQTKTLSFTPDGVGLGAGVQIHLGLGPLSSLGIGAFYGHQKVKTSFNTDGGLPASGTIDASLVDIPITYNLWLASLFSVGAGLYYTKYKSTKSTAKVGTTSSTITTPAATGSNDIGVIGSVNLKIPGLLSGILLSANYKHGLKKEQVSEVVGLAGFCFSFF